MISDMDWEVSKVYKYAKNPPRPKMIRRNWVNSSKKRLRDQDSNKESSSSDCQCMNQEHPDEQKL